MSSDLKGPGKPGARTARVVRLAILVIVLAAPVIGLLTWHPAQRNGNGQISHAGPITPDDLKVGDCFNAPDATSGISSVQAIPCTKPHDSQVFAKPAITESTYPGQTVLQSEADADCGDANRQSVISKSRPTGMSLINLFPQDDATLADQDYIICAIKSSTGTLTQSYVDASGVRS